jgi:hypothetical protein
MDDEARELSGALERHLHGLRVELADTDDREYRADLRAQMARLERVAARLDQELAPAKAESPALTDG